MLRGFKAEGSNGDSEGFPEGFPGGTPEAFPLPPVQCSE